MSRLQKLLGVGKGYLERLPPVDVHKLLRIVLMNLPYIVIFYVGNKLAWLYQYCVGDSMIERLMVLILNFQMAFSRILPSMHTLEFAPFGLKYIRWGGKKASGRSAVQK